LAVVAGMKKTNDHAEPTKVERSHSSGVFPLIIITFYLVLTDAV